MKLIILIIGVLAISSCKPKQDVEARCHDVVEHMRTVTAMPMRDGDVMMIMGACKMWTAATLDCLLASKTDDDIKQCRGGDGSARSAAAPPHASEQARSAYLDSTGRDDV